jgi:hypothetical protein
MPIHIAPIGEHTEHVIEWLRDPVMTNIGALTKIYLIHSKKGKIDFPRKAKDLEKKIKSNYAGVEVIKRVIGNPLHIDDTLEEIIKIIYDELEDESIINKEIAINVTGGTNAMAAAAILAATMRGTKAYYVLDRRMNPRQKSYVEELPVPSIGVAEMNTNAKKVLDLIDDASKEKLPITNQDILIEMGWGEKIRNNDIPGMRNRQKGATTLASIVKNLEKDGYITIIKEVTENKPVTVGASQYTRKVRKRNQNRYEITSAGRRRVKDNWYIDQKTQKRKLIKN